MTARVQDDGETSTAFPVTNGVKQGCVLAPTLFSIVFTAMLTDAFHGTKEGIDIKYRTDGKLLNQRRLLALTKVKHTVLKDFLFADDCALNATSGQDMQVSTDRFSGACDNFGLIISTKKTEVLYQPRPGKPYKEPCVTVHGQVLNPVDKFTYLGSTMSRQANIDEEVNGRISKASSVFGRLRRNVWDRRGIKLSTKLKVYQAVVITTLLYAYHIPDTEVLSRANMPSIHTLIEKAQARWAGHVRRMNDSRIPKMLLYGELAEGKRLAGRPKLRFKDSLKATLKSLSIPVENWEDAATDRHQWRRLVHQGAELAERRRISLAVSKREARKAREKNPSLQPLPIYLNTSVTSAAGASGLELDSSATPGHTRTEVGVIIDCDGRTSSSSITISPSQRSLMYILYLIRSMLKAQASGENEEDGNTIGNIEKEQQNTQNVMLADSTVNDECDMEPYAVTNMSDHQTYLNTTTNVRQQAPKADSIVTDDGDMEPYAVTDHEIYFSRTTNIRQQASDGSSHDTTKNVHKPRNPPNAKELRQNPMYIPNNQQPCGITTGVYHNTPGIKKTMQEVKNFSTLNETELIHVPTIWTTDGTNSPSIGGVNGTNPHNLGTTDGTTPPSLETTDGTTSPNLGTTDGTTPPKLGTTDGTTPPSLGTTEGTTPPSLGTTEGTTPPSLGTTVGTTPPNLGTTDGTTPPNLGTTECTTPSNLGTTDGITPPSFGTTDGITPPSLGTTDGTTSPNLGTTDGTTHPALGPLRVPPHPTLGPLMVPPHPALGPLLGTTEGTTTPSLGTTDGTTPSNLGTTVGTTPPSLGTTEGTTPLNLGTTDGTTLPNLGTTVGTTPPNLGTTDGTTPPSLGTTEGTTPPNLGTTEGTTPPNLGTTEEILSGPVPKTAETTSQSANQAVFKASPNEEPTSPGQDKDHLRSDQNMLHTESTADNSHIPTPTVAYVVPDKIRAENSAMYTASRENEEATAIGNTEEEVKQVDSNANKSGGKGNNKTRRDDDFYEDGDMEPYAVTSMFANETYLSGTTDASQQNPDDSRHDTTVHTHKLDNPPKTRGLIPNPMYNANVQQASDDTRLCNSPNGK
ncbi:hypothetical protein Bbelb_302560 [Branchiostoma belcheri]|nr:hypothetical protein Bbelb_302560 [Branchiostoma belcheri]